MTDKSDTVWYGVCGNSYGCFDPKYVRFERNIETSVSYNLCKGNSDQILPPLLCPTFYIGWVVQ